VFFFDRQYRLYLVDVDPNGIGCDGVSIQLFYNGTIILIHGRRRVAVFVPVNLIGGMLRFRAMIKDITVFVAIALANCIVDFLIILHRLFSDI
jgi:hypothetical protein